MTLRRASSGSTTKMRPARSAIGGFVDSRSRSGFGYESIAGRAHRLRHLKRSKRLGPKRTLLREKYRGNLPPPPQDVARASVLYRAMFWKKGPAVPEKEGPVSGGSSI